MASTPIYNWPTPDNTDLVKNGALAIRTLGNAIDTTVDTMIPETIFAAKGDLLGASANDTPAITSVGANNTYLIADSTASTGLAWAAGTYTTFTPGGFSGFTLGNGTATGRYRVFGKTVFMEANITLGSTSSVTGSFTMQFPVSASTLYNFHYIGLANFRDTGVGEFPARVWQTGTNFFLVFPDNTSGTYATSAATSSTVPFTWTTGDIINITATYEAA